jgi:hypothetical protein
MPSCAANIKDFLPGDAICFAAVSGGVEISASPAKPLPGKKCLVDMQVLDGPRLFCDICLAGPIPPRHQGGLRASMPKGRFFPR